jgi:hypothetical protein
MATIPFDNDSYCVSLSQSTPLFYLLSILRTLFCFPNLFSTSSFIHSSLVAAANMMSKLTPQRRFSNGGPASSRSRGYSYTWPDNDNNNTLSSSPSHAHCTSPSPKSPAFTFPMPGLSHSRQSSTSESISSLSSGGYAPKSPGYDEEARSPFSPVFGKTPKFLRD